MQVSMCQDHVAVAVAVAVILCRLEPACVAVGENSSLGLLVQSITMAGWPRVAQGLHRGIEILSTGVEGAVTCVGMCSDAVRMEKDAVVTGATVDGADEASSDLAPLLYVGAQLANDTLTPSVRHASPVLAQWLPL